MQTKLGGERLGSGKKMTVNLRNFNRSTHNLSETWLSSMAPGVLYPFYCNVGVNGDTFNIDLQAAARTIPTQGPMFGTFKLQLDMFAIPLRLYNGILHNNQVNIGLQMSKVLLPKVKISQRPIYVTTYEEGTLNIPRETDLETEIEKFGINPSSLVKYLGYSGVGLANTDPRNEGGEENIQPLTKLINACPFLAYYDIFKNYYANKQEKQAFVITNMPKENDIIIDEISIYKYDSETKTYVKDEEELPLNDNITYHMQRPQDAANNFYDYYYRIDGTELALTKISIKTTELEYTQNTDGTRGESTYVTKNYTLEELVRKNYIDIISDNNLKIEFYFKYNRANHITSFKFEYANTILEEPQLTPFNLENIDEYRKRCLKTVELDEQLIFKNTYELLEREIYPIKAVTNWQLNDKNEIQAANETALNGLLVKTYQSDIFNNFLNTELITGENGINEITKINVSEGLSMDALILQKKVYDMLNRIAVKGNTYQDWQEAVYTQKATRMAEIPLWIGGMSQEIVFEEIIQTAPSEGTPLGNLGGKGRLLGNQHGGHIKYKCDEPCLIMGIVSITPRLTYSQGNAWYMTEINSINDLHKPSLDGIGFQDLMAQQANWATSLLDTEDQAWNDTMAIGKTPAWINYMTAFDKCYGDFALNQGKSYMVLNRNYETTFDEDGNFNGYMGTYIDPAKFNYAFAYSSLDAQNFWVQIRSTITARRLMSAKVIPNL